MDGTSAATRLAAGRHNPANQETEMTTSNSTTETVRFGTFGPIVWNNETGEARVATQADMDELEVGTDLTAEEEDAIEE